MNLHNRHMNNKILLEQELTNELKHKQNVDILKQALINYTKAMHRHVNI